jgi:hypothetical protein
MTRNEAWLLWKRTPTPEVEAEVRRIEQEAYEHDEYAPDLSELTFLAFFAGLRAAKAPG